MQITLRETRRRRHFATARVRFPVAWVATSAVAFANPRMTTPRNANQTRCAAQSTVIGPSRRQCAMVDSPAIWLPACHKAKTENLYLYTRRPSKCIDRSV